mmetsp:Transcript_9359/g.28191  ORF Transcript_9359/g.28191 Transcript_9359/m.28191 type:complete len:283 (+) Transcript_9359:27-875(+)|eukprot:CAMPEP_0198728948 /NCGR_PEP_ID=MMETSP1475-20131203/12564_1 /TAXON_ID= ORGANISM="Unidentified sp., Strain CCMP1999" /NCGR_SAMPLE_ID=MMETSP1475 /ASSEMBLY_ACC=CAM_ASM_001111 /LENGTH=282 /DNA_ID=CAMNT_0044491455 /DNA_START=15 /DNA_END=863 /DNA_ORIENTATION=+
MGNSFCVPTKFDEDSPARKSLWHENSLGDPRRFNDDVSKSKKPNVAATNSPTNEVSSELAKCQVPLRSDTKSAEKGKNGSQSFEASLVTSEGDESTQSSREAPVKEEKRKYREVQSIRFGGVDEVAIEDVGNLIKNFETANAESGNNEVHGKRPLSEIGLSRTESAMIFNHAALYFDRMDDERERETETNVEWKKELPSTYSKANFEALTRKFHDEERTTEMSREVLQPCLSKEKFRELTGRFVADTGQIEYELSFTRIDDSMSFVSNNDSGEAQELSAASS